MKPPWKPREKTVLSIFLFHPKHTKSELVINYGVPRPKRLCPGFCDPINTNNCQKPDMILWKNLGYIIKSLGKRAHRCMNGTHTSSALMSMSMEILQTCLWTKTTRDKEVAAYSPKSNLHYFHRRNNQKWFTIQQYPNQVNSKEKLTFNYLRLQESKIFPKIPS